MKWNNTTGSGRVTHYPFSLCRMSLPVLVPAFSVFIAVIFTRRAIRERRNADELFKNGVKVQGTVVGYRLHVNSPAGSDGGAVEYPLIQFKTVSGELVEVEKKSQIPGLNKYETVVVFYDVSNPQNVVFDSEVGSPLPYLLPGAIWLVAIATTCLFFINR